MDSWIRVLWKIGKSKNYILVKQTLWFRVVYMCVYIEFKSTQRGQKAKTTR